MQTYIALLRGVNVGGHNKMPMAALREVLSKAGLEAVKTYIQSGNVVFQSSIEHTKIVEELIQKTINDYFGFSIPVLVKTRAQLQTILDRCPFSDEKKVNSYFAMLSEIPDANLVTEASQKTYANEEYVISNDVLYFYCANGYGKAKFSLSYFEAKLRLSATARNYKTMIKLLALSV